MRRLKAGFRALGLKAGPKESAALPGLIKDALDANGTTPEERDATLLAAIESIFHYGLAVYTSIERYLRGAQAKKARKLLKPSLKEKREAIEEMLGMGSRQVTLLEGPSVDQKNKGEQGGKRKTKRGSRRQGR